MVADVVASLTKSTSRPPHYHVLGNGNKLRPDEIQSLTNNLCYTFGRCSTSNFTIGTAPSTYAHVVAQRYRKLIDTWGGSDTNTSVRCGELQSQSRLFRN